MTQQHRRADSAERIRRNGPAKRRERFGIAAFAAWLAIEAIGVAQSSGGFVKLFDGTLTGWTVENSTAGNFSVRDGVLRVEGPGGWLRSAREFGDVTVRVEFRFLTDDADSGLFLRANPTGQFGRGWPTSAYQVQIRNPATPRPFPPVGGLFRHGTPPGETNFDQAAVEQVVKAAGEWQILEATVAGDRLTAQLNGRDVLRAGGIANPRGFIGLQGETGALEFRALEVREHATQSPPP